LPKITNDDDFKAYRSAIIKEYQIIIDQSKELLKKKLQRNNNIDEIDLQKYRYKDFFLQIK
jgi:hypothetical protein